MEKLIEYIERLEKESFVEWSQDAEDGYLTACGSIKAKAYQLLRDGKRKLLKDLMKSTRRKNG